MEGDYERIKSKNYQKIIDDKNIPLIKKTIKILKCENIDFEQDIKVTKKLILANKNDIKRLEAALLEIKERGT